MIHKVFVMRHSDLTRILLGLLLLVLGRCAPHDHDYLVFVGTYTGSGSEGIYAYRFNSVNGSLMPIGLAARTPNPSFLVLDARGEFLYSVNETDTFRSSSTDVRTGAISVFSVNRESGALTQIQQVSSEGAGPCHLSLDRTGRYLFVANYGGGSVAVFPVGADGRLEPHTQFIQGAGSSIHPKRQTQPHAHFIQATPDNRFVLIADLGRDQVMAGRFEDGRITLGPSAPVEPGSGPRHLTFSPSRAFHFVLNELTSTITTYSLDPESGTVKALGTVPALPEDFSGTNTSAEIVTVNGRYLYVSNRGHDTLGLFSIDQQSGNITAVEWVPSGGVAPRHFEIDPSGRWLLAANQGSDNLTLFRIDPSSGRLKSTGKVRSVSAPVCVRFTPVH